MAAASAPLLAALVAVRPHRSSRDREATLFEAFFDRARPAPWSALSWGVLVPVMFVGNVALAIVAWYAVEFTMKLF
jgi:hypothetical protein